MIEKCIDLLSILPRSLLELSYERIKHMPTHAARKQRTKAEIRAMDREREGYERELEQALVAEARALVKAFRSL